MINGSKIRRPLIMVLAILLGCASILIGVVVGLCAAIGLFVTIWGPEAILGPPPGFLAFLGFITIMLPGMLMGVVTSYVIVILPLSFRLNSWYLAGCQDRRVAYYAKGLSTLMESWSEEQMKRDNSKK
jgi:hypothetical protein